VESRVVPRELKALLAMSVRQLSQGHWSTLDNVVVIRCVAPDKGRCSTADVDIRESLVQA
jgi:hypothetical protein